MLGQRCRPLEAKNTYGTGCFLLLHTGTEPVASEAGLLTTMVCTAVTHALPCTCSVYSWWCYMTSHVWRCLQYMPVP